MKRVVAASGVLAVVIALAILIGAIHCSGSATCLPPSLRRPSLPEVVLRARGADRRQRRSPSRRGSIRSSSTSTPRRCSAAADYASARKTTALIVGRHGHIVFEQYWDDRRFDTVSGHSASSTRRSRR